MRQKIVHLARGILERELDVIEPRGLERADSCFIEADSGSDEIGVVAEAMRMRDDLRRVGEDLEGAWKEIEPAEAKLP